MLEIYRSTFLYITFSIEGQNMWMYIFFKQLKKESDDELKSRVTFTVINGLNF